MRAAGGVSSDRLERPLAQLEKGRARDNLPPRRRARDVHVELECDTSGGENDDPIAKQERLFDVVGNQQHRSRLAGERRRDGAFEWGVFEDAVRHGRFVETFKVDSWIEHLRQHERVTQADRELQESVNRFQIDGAPVVTHLIART